MNDGNEVFFRIKRSTQLKKLMNAYCDRQSVDFNSIAFLFDGRRLRAEQTPDELEMEDGDEIDAMLHQTGGSVLLPVDFGGIVLPLQYDDYEWIVIFLLYLC
ncbi:Small ubiquitin-related modifier 2 [Glycine soja]